MTWTTPAVLQPIEFETERLRLRQWLVSDRLPFAALNADPRVMAFFPALLDRAASDAMADRCQALIAKRGWGFWAAETKADRQFIGFVGLHIPSPHLPFSPCVEIGWRLASPYWGKGLASEAGRGALRIGFERLDLPEIVAFTTLDNVRSRAVMARLGMRESGRFEHPALPPESPLRTHCLYRLARSTWLAPDHNDQQRSTLPLTPRLPDGRTRTDICQCIDINRIGNINSAFQS